MAIIDKPQRKVIRLQHYDYTQVGLYFITICTNERKCLFGDVVDNELLLNEAGKMIEYWYKEIENHFKTIYCLDYIIMPNHIHFILEIREKQPHSIFSVIQWFKTMTTNYYIKNVKTNNWQCFYKKLWQRSYYEHIIRNEKSFFEICDYIKNNPLNWHLDKLYQE